MEGVLQEEGNCCALLHVIPAAFLTVIPCKACGIPTAAWSFKPAFAFLQAEARCAHLSTEPLLPRAVLALMRQNLTTQRQKNLSAVGFQTGLEKRVLCLRKGQL